LLLLAAILLVAVLLQNVLRPAPPPPTVTVQVVVARQGIEPYSLIEPGQVGLGTEEISSTAAKAYYLKPEEVVGLMSTGYIKAGSKLALEDADRPENVRYVENMQLEVVSFPAVFNEMVAGQVKPGHKINIYGYRKKSEQSDSGEMAVVATRVWVVDVRTSGGDVVQQGQGATTQPAGGFLAAPSTSGETGPGSVVTVAAEPSVVQDIIRAFGADGYSAYVTLAPAEPYVLVATPTPIPEPTPAPTLPTTPPPSTPSAVRLDLYMTKSHGSPRREEYFVNGSTTVWVAVELEYTPASGPTEIEIDVRKDETTLFPRQQFTHPGSSWEWYALEIPTGLPSNAKLTTTIYAQGPAKSVVWWTNADGQSPRTGG
jgi:hypothetical protein